MSFYTNIISAAPGCTPPFIDVVAGKDWVAQSYERQKLKKKVANERIINNVISKRSFCVPMYYTVERYSRIT